MRLRIPLDPTHWVYILIHALIIAAGMFVIIATDSPVWVGVGTSLIATGITGETIFLYIFLSRDLSERVHALTQFGVVRIFDARSVRIRAEYDQRLTGARERIDILGYGLRSLREDYLDSFAAWRERAHVRILLLDPSFPSASFSLAAQRDAEERQNVGTIAQDVRDFMDSVLPIVRAEGKYPFEVKLYRALPTLNIFRVDDDLFFGPYLLKQPSRNTPTVLLRRGGILFDRISAHFETLWCDPSLSVSIDEPNE